MVQSCEFVSESIANGSEVSAHISLTTLWRYSRSELDISEVQFRHILNCDACVSAMGLCHILPTINRVEEEITRI